DVVVRSGPHPLVQELEGVVATTDRTGTLEHHVDSDAVDERRARDAHLAHVRRGPRAQVRVLVDVDRGAGRVGLGSLLVAGPRDQVVGTVGGRRPGDLVRRVLCGADELVVDEEVHALDRVTILALCFSHDGDLLLVGSGAEHLVVRRCGDLDRRARTEIGRASCRERGRGRGDYGYAGQYERS